MIEFAGFQQLTVFDVYDRDRQTAYCIAIATRALSAAADSFTQAAPHLSDAQAAPHLSDAQAAIPHQGVNEDSTDNLRRRPTTASRPLTTNASRPQA